MGIGLEQYRQAIGLWSARIKNVRIRKCEQLFVSNFSLFYVGVVLSVLLIVGGIELNPGPYTLEDVIEKLDEMNSNIIGINKVTAELSQQIKQLTKEVEQARSENEKLKEEIKQNEIMIDKLENQSRRNNLVFYNIYEQERETWNESETIVRQFLWDELGVNTTDYDLERTHRLGARRGRNHNRPIIAKFNSFKKKSEVLACALKAKNTPVSISEDFSHRVRSIRSDLKTYLIRARSEGLRAKLNYDKLYIEGKPYKLEDFEYPDRIFMNLKSRCDSSNNFQNAQVEDANNSATRRATSPQKYTGQVIRDKSSRNNFQHTNVKITRNDSNLTTGHVANQQRCRGEGIIPNKSNNPEKSQIPVPSNQEKQSQRQESQDLSATE